MSDSSNRDDQASQWLQEQFSYRDPEPPRPLPAMFDDECNRCKRQKMEQMPAICLTEIKPFVIFQCPSCKVRLHLYESGEHNRPLFVWSNQEGTGITTKEHLAERIRERDRDEQRRARRAGRTIEFA